MTETFKINVCFDENGEDLEELNDKYQIALEEVLNK